MNGEPDAAAIIKAARGRKPKAAPTPGGESQPAPVTKPEAAAEAVSGDTVDDSPAADLERLGVSAEAAAEAVDRYRRMWGK